MIYYQRLPSVKAGGMGYTFPCLGLRNWLFIIRWILCEAIALRPKITKHLNWTRDKVLESQALEMLQTRESLISCVQVYFPSHVCETYVHTCVSQEARDQKCRLL